MTDYDSSYYRFRRETNPQLDLKINHHRIALIKWLNGWGCRQFALDYHGLASEEIHSWYQQYGDRFFSPDKSLLDLTSSDLALVKRAYAELVVRTASMREQPRGGQTKVEIGPKERPKYCLLSDQTPSSRGTSRSVDISNLTVQPMLT